ncbi:DNA primase [Streptosporangium sp. NPDC048047]|uniref:DNA primase n=1 Tax=Streptosporangium sp. NPDC048047 TaxID=3155748 RepID=UPI00341A52BB
MIRIRYALAAGAVAGSGLVVPAALAAQPATADTAARVAVEQPFQGYDDGDDGGGGGYGNRGWNDDDGYDD